MLSPELAIAFAVGTSCYFLRFVNLHRRASFLAFAATLGAMGLLSYVAARFGVFLTMLAFGSGGGNLPVMSAPHLLLLFCITGLAACYVGERFRLQQPDALTMLIAVSACSLTAALSGCDPVHVLPNPLGVVLAGSFYAPFGFAPGRFGTYHSPALDEGAFFENENVFTTAEVQRKVLEMRTHPERPLVLLPGRENACTVKVAIEPPAIRPPFY